MSNASVRLRITGDVGSACTIQWANNLQGTNNWRFLTNLTALSSSPCLVADANPVAAPRFYRAFAQQVPTNVVTTNMVWIPPGTFVMGSPMSEANHDANETQHTVTLTKGFYMAKYEVTQREYLTVIGYNPSLCTTQDFWGRPIAPDLNRPVEQVDAGNAAYYCASLTQREQAAGRLPSWWAYRLPTESEWEYACRAETTTAFGFGSAIHEGMAWFWNSYEYDAAIGTIYVPDPTVLWLPQPTTVGSYPPNAWGLYDMHGNVEEWCSDWMGDYPTGSVTDPQGPPPASGYYRVMRGGSWHRSGAGCRSAWRDYYRPEYKDASVGFRVVLALSQP